MTDLLVSIVIVNYKDYDNLRLCLRSLRDCTYNNIEIIVVDNEYDRSSLDPIEKQFNKVKFFPMQTNLNYAEGNNFGISKASGEFVVILNSDTLVKGDWLEPLVERALSDLSSFYQPKILFSDDQKMINSLGNAVHVLGFAFPRAIGKSMEEAGTTDSSAQEVFYCSGACIFASRHLLEKMGGFDSNYWTYYEDVNLGWRGRLQGHKCYMVPASTIYHRWGASYGKHLSPTKLYLLERGRISTILRNYSMRTIFLVMPVVIFMDALMVLYLLRRPALAKAKMNSSLAVIRRVKSIFSERASLQSNRTVTDGEIKKLLAYDLSHPYFETIPGFIKFSTSTISKAIIRSM